ncbi:Putative phage tail protein [Bradyrhizobium sp. NFR13]|uniref:host specificity factor TipJ family phage tail protein n=1 Tax=Bradyrhizobium sp. NFR13 TaxID=1566285 RepID=UPI0008E5D923|nr:host specificity factor TipJ family phage tail protein [Bradyrhizobium sp. NFR13]SFM00729.1 Putative phage tail protein [Bradyrhizobium sp. NFR13]
MHAPVHKLPALPSPQRSRSRRERRSDAARKPVLLVVMPGQEIARAEIKPWETISSFLRRVGWASRDRKHGWQFRKGLPTVLEINGERVVRRLWTTKRIAANDNVRFVSYPLGGQGSSAKQVIGLVALVAVSAFALWAGPAFATAIGYGGSAVVGGLATAAIGIGGSLLINALTAPKAGATNAPDATQDQIYSVSAQGNAAKLGEPLPVWHGRLKRYPDFAATPWGEFVGNDQYLNVLLSVSMGSMDYETVFVSDTPMWTAADGVLPSFSTAQIEFYEPGAPVTLFPVSVVSSDEVSGPQLPDGSGTFGGQYEAPSAQTPGAWIGGFIVNAAGTLVQSIAIDYVLPGGCFTVNTDSDDPNRNNIGSAIVGIGAEICPVNDAGAPIGSYATLFQVQRSYASTAPIRDTIKVDVGEGRYLVRFRRLDAALPSQQGSNQVVWAGLRGFLKGDNSFPDVSTIAIRIKASESTQGSYKFGVLATRKLPVWNGSTFVLQATRNPGWAFLDAVSNAQYGSGLSLAKVDFNTLASFAANCDTRGDTFDYCFSAATAVPEAFDKILTPARARHFWLGDTISVVRDEWRDVPAMLLTDREIVRDSTQVTFTMLGDEDPDAVVVEYVDQDTWRPAQVQYPPDDMFFQATHAEVKRIDGIIKRDQAYREAAFYYLQSIYRRENVQIGTEYEGRAITFGSVLRVQSELPMAYGYGGAVTGAAGTSLTLSPSPVWEDGPFYIRLRRPNGKWFGPVIVTKGAGDAIAILDADDLADVETAQGIVLADVLAREDGGEDPSFEFGTAESQSKLCVVLNGTPNGDTCTLNLVVDDIRVHTTDLGSPPALPSSQFPTNANVPLLIGLNATFGQGTAEPKLEASWFPSPGALYYVADISFDGGNSWQQVYEGQDNKFSQVVTLAALKLRVQAVSASVAGPYSSVDLSAPTIVVAPGTVALSSVVAGIRDQITTIFDREFAQINAAKNELAKIAQQIAARTDINKKEVRTQLFATAGNAKALIEQLSVVVADQALAFASFSTEVSATFGPDFSSVNTVSEAVATLDGFAASQYAVTLDVNGYGIGFNLFNGGPSTSAAIWTVDKFQIAAPGVTGGAPVPIFTVSTVGGAPKVGIRGDVIIDGSVTAGKMSVGYLSAISGNIGEVIAGIIRSSDNKFRILLDESRLEVWS